VLVLVGRRGRWVGMGMEMGGCGAMSCRIVTPSWRGMGCFGVCFTVSLSLWQMQNLFGLMNGMAVVVVVVVMAEMSFPYFPLSFTSGVSQDTRCSLIRKAGEQTGQSTTDTSVAHRQHM